MLKRKERRIHYKEIDNRLEKIKMDLLSQMHYRF